MVSRVIEKIRAVLRWALLGAVVGALSGIASAAFLLLLDRATHLRESHQVIVFALPVAGLVLGAILSRFGAPIAGGTNLVLDTLDDAEHAPQLPSRMPPMVLLGTVLTHLFGGSAGREGTAVQMGAGLADELAHRLKIKGDLRRELLAAGIAGGFGSVFGTPIAGALFGLEVVRVGRIEYRALLPALVSATVGDLVTRRLGVEHTHYPLLPHLSLTPLLIGKWIVFGLAIGLVAVVFVEATHALKKLLTTRISSMPLRLALGGVLVVAMWQLVGSSDYLGLGVPTIVRAFSDDRLPMASFAFKLAFTVVTLGAGFLGGEVTPLFFVGAALGNLLGRVMGLPLGMAAGVGLASLFGAASNAPIALVVMAVELLGGEVLPHVMLVMVVAYLASGHRSIYPAQRIRRGKVGGPDPDRTVALRDL